MNLLRRFRTVNWRIVAITFVAASILHICATFAAPQLVVTTAYSKMKARLPLNSMIVLPPIDPDTQPLPFMAPDVRYAMCRYDTRDGPVTLKAHLPDAGWTLSLYSPQGDSFYAATGLDERPISIALQIVPTGERFFGLTPEASGRASTRNPKQMVSSVEGIAVLRAPDKGVAYQQVVESQIARATCRPGKF